MSPLWWFLPFCITAYSILWAVYWPYVCNNWWGWTILIIRLFCALVISLLVWMIASFTQWGMS